MSIKVHIHTTQIKEFDHTSVVKHHVKNSNEIFYYIYVNSF